nr:histone arginine methyltransferase PRMT3 [Toxoplasma gondii TgCATBr9]
MGVFGADCDSRLRAMRGLSFDKPIYGLDFSLLHLPDAFLLRHAEVAELSPDCLLSDPSPFCLIDLYSATTEQVQALRAPFSVDLTRRPSSHRSFPSSSSSSSALAAVACPTLTTLLVYFECFFDRTREGRAGDAPISFFAGPQSFGTAQNLKVAAATTGGDTRSSGAAGEPATREKRAGFVCLSTSPLSPGTHWKQTLLHLRVGRRVESVEEKANEKAAEEERKLDKEAEAVRTALLQLCDLHWTQKTQTQIDSTRLEKKKNGRHAQETEGNVSAIFCLIFFLFFLSVSFALCLFMSSLCANVCVAFLALNRSVSLGNLLGFFFQDANGNGVAVTPRWAVSTTEEAAVSEEKSEKRTSGESGARQRAAVDTLEGFLSLNPDPERSRSLVLTVEMQRLPCQGESGEISVGPCVNSFSVA